MLFKRPNKRQIILADHGQVAQVLRHLGSIVEQSAEAVAVVNLQGAVHFVNAAWARMHGYENSAALLGRSVRSFQSRDQTDADAVSLIDKAGPDGQLAQEVRHVRKNGIPFAAQMRAVVLKDDSDNAIGLIIFVAERTVGAQGQGESAEHSTDTAGVEEQLQHQINEHKRSEQTLKEQIAELREVNKALHEQLTEHEQEGKKLEEQVAELTSAYEELKSQTTASEQSKEHLDRLASVLAGVCDQFGQQVAEHTQANEQLKGQIAELNEACEQIENQTDLDESMDGGPRRGGGEGGGMDETTMPFDIERLKEVADMAKRLNKEPKKGKKKKQPK
ncbi:MAG: PAS domain-containing protein [Planctomycetota bacterium]|jgi:PAS domain S-box-containing protein